MSGAPCRCCGVATTGPVTRRVVYMGARPVEGRSYDVGTCAACLTLDLDRPGAAVRAALRLLGKNERDDELAAGVFIEAGLDVTYLMFEARERPEAQRKAWGHVTSEEKDALRSAYLQVLDARVHAASGRNRPLPAKPPPTGPPACLACGVGKSPGWRKVVTGALTRGPDYIEGHLCAVCADVYDSVGALGKPFLEKAVMEANGLNWTDATRIPGLRAWVATGRGPGQPWAWLRVSEAPPEIDALTALQMQVADLSAEVARLEGKPA